MIDVKKLIIGFLILATAAVCSGLVLSLVGNSHATTNASTAVQITGAGTNQTPSPAAMNVFVNTGSLQGNAAEVLSDTETTSTETQASDPDNLTNVFANSFLNGLDAANPDGVTVDQSGAPEFAAPDTQAVAEDIASNPALQNFTVPDWDLEAQSQVIKTIPGSTPTDIAQYGNSLNAIFAQDFVSTNLENDLNSQTGDPSDLPYIASQVQSALNNTLAIQTPAPLAGLQTSLVRVMVYEKDAVQLAENANDDPVKTALILEDEQSKYSAALTDLQQQIQSASSLGLSFNANASPEASVPFIAQLFGVQPAHAIFGIGDITFDPTVFGQMLLQYVQSTILQILKNTLVALIQKKVLTAIQGNGAPKFVQDWGAELVNSFQSAALSTLGGELALAPSYQVPALQMLLSTPYQAANNVVNSAAAAINPNNPNLANGNFTDFNNYLAIFGPGGNIWSNAMTIQQNALVAGAISQAANQAQNIAQQGYNATLGGCSAAQGGGPTGSRPVCTVGTISGGSCISGGVVVGVPVNIPYDGKCGDGSNPSITSPGQVVGQSLGAALNSSISNITSANNIVGLLNALTTSLLNTLAQNAINAASGAVNGVLTPDPGLQGIPPGSVGTPPPSSPSTQTGVTCLPSIQPAVISTSTGLATASLSAGGGAIDTTCAINNSCPSTINPDGTPIYNWTAAGSTQGGNGTITLTGQSLLLSYATPGTYSATVTASTDHSQATCQITVTSP